MAHALRYYKNLTLDNGRRIRIEFHEKDGTANAMELGDVIQSLNLEIPGGGDVDQPIVKTMLNFTFIDAPDHADHKTKKCGAWEEFYSPDATHWKVLLLYKNEGETSYTQFWGGYITPDSFHESLTYRAGISFIARDNIGHLQDFPFDAEGNADGMITLYDLLMSAWAKIESPMELEAKTDGDVEWLRCDGTNALFTYMNVSAFEGKNWLEVVEEVLYGYGLVMRYVGENYVYVYPLRNLAVFPYPGSGVDVIFESGAERELSPAVRRIEESVDYEIEEALSQPLVNNKIDFSGEINEYEFTLDNNPYVIYYWSLNNTKEGSGWINNSSLPSYFNPLAYALADNVDTNDLQYMWIADTISRDSLLDGRAIEYSRYIEASSIKVDIQFGNMYRLVDGVLTKAQYNYPKHRAYYLVSITQNGITRYLDSNGEWAVEKGTLNQEISEGLLSFDIPQGDYIGEVLLSVKVISLSSQGAMYYPIYSFTYAPTNTPLLTKNNINTNYNNSNNVVLSRSPKIAPAMNTTFMQGVIKNGIFVQQGTRYYPAPLWSWNANGDGAQQMAVYNHLQLLCFHAKPNNILSGTILNADVTNIGKVYRWNGTEHLLVSGTLNLITGFIENATLREFTRYENMWGELTDTADLPEVEGNSTNNLEGGARTSGNTATYSNTTEVNIGGGGNIVLDAFMSDSSTNGVQNKVVKAYIDSNVNTLEGNVEKRALQSDFANLSKTVQSNSGTLSGVVMDLSTIEQWKNLLASVLVVKDGNLYCLSNLIVEGDTSSGGDGEDNPSGGITDADLEGYAKEEWVRERFQALITQTNKLSYGLLKDTPVLGTLSKINVATEGGKFMMTTGRGDVVWVVLDKSRVGLSNVDNTADANKNVASATKLTTARTLWGNPFNGTQDINGNILLPKGKYLFGGTGEEGIYITDSTISWHNSDNLYSKSFVKFDGSDKYLTTIYSNLHVEGNATFSQTITVDDTVYIQGSTTNPYIRFTLNNKNWYCQAYNDGKSDGIFLGSTVIKSLKVDADGQVYCPKDLIVSGDTASGSDVRFKDIQEDADIKVEDIANAPYFAFKWNDREDNETHVGTSAQYWEKILPELVNGEDFKTLNYGSLGVGMGIALAKRLLESERRVKAMEDELKEIRRMLDEKRK